MKGNKHLIRNRVCDLDKKRTVACILFFLFTLLLLTPTISVADEVTIGTDYCLYDHLPVEPYFCFTYSQSIFLQGDINASGPIYIDSIKYHWNGCGSWTDDIQVYMGHTTYSSFSTWKPLSTMTEVYSGGYSVSASAGWYKIVLDESFYYNNSDNLVIAVDEDTYTYHSSSQSFYTTSQGTNRSIYYYSDSYNPNPSSPPTGTLSSYCPNIKIYYHHATIPPTVTTHPESQEIDEGGDVDFTVVATGTPELTYQWYKNGTSIGGETSTTLSLNSVPLLDDGSTYFAVVSNSEGSDTSNTATLTVYGYGGGSSPALCDVWATNAGKDKIWPIGRVVSVGIGKIPTTELDLDVKALTRVGGLGIRCIPTEALQVHGNAIIQGRNDNILKIIDEANKNELIIGTDINLTNFMRIRPKQGDGIAITNNHDKIGVFVSADNGDPGVPAKVGIGTSEPSTQLHVKKEFGGQPTVLIEQTNNHPNLAFSDGTKGMRFEFNKDANEIKLQTCNEKGEWVDGSSQLIATFKSDGRVAIGTDDPGDYKLAVNGDIKTKKIVVTQQEWSDNVFKDDYDLKPLEEVESYIKQNGHLPGIPSEQEVKKNGLNVGEMQARLLAQIEEMTLLMIKMNKRIDELESRLDIQK